MITAEEFMLENLQSMDMQEVENAMIEFAKLHVAAALKAASEKAETKIVFGCFEFNVVDTDTILDSYSLENIM